MATTTTDEFGNITTVIPPDEVARTRRLQELLRPDHNCTGSGGFGVNRDGSMTMTHRPCPGCKAQQERVQREHPDLVPSRIASVKRFAAKELLAKIESEGYWPSNSEWLDFLRSMV